MDFDEYVCIMSQHIKKEFTSVSDIIDDIKNEFKRANTSNSGFLSIHQVEKVFLNLNVDLKEEELKKLFNEIDKDKSGGVDI